MDAATLVARLEQARTYTQAVAGVTFTVRRPTVEAYALWCEEHRKGDRLDTAAMARARLPGCIVGWQGLTLRHLGGDTDEPVPYALELVPVALADAPHLASELFVGLLARINARAEAMRQDEKNSSSVSTPA
jgi:hypothetical protein